MSERSNGRGPSRAEAFLRAIRLVCPQCGGGPLFAGFFRMHDGCANCGLRFSPEPGFYLGSIYINYGITVVGIGLLYALLVLGCGVSQRTALTACLVAAVAFPIWFFRYARSLLLALDSAVNRQQGRESADASSLGAASGIDVRRLESLRRDDASAGCLMGVALAAILLFGLLMAVVTLVFSGGFSSEGVPPGDRLDLSLLAVPLGIRYPSRVKRGANPPGNRFPCPTRSLKRRPAASLPVCSRAAATRSVAT